MCELRSTVYFATGVLLSTQGMTYRVGGVSGISVDASIAVSCHKRGLDEIWNAGPFQLLINMRTLSRITILLRLLSCFFIAGVLCTTIRIESHGQVRPKAKMTRTELAE